MIDGFRSIDTVLNQFNFFDEYANPEIQRLLNKREKARSQKNWELADKLRDELKSLGILVQDQN
jgi:cysteinyl-tRNA synthetase